MSFEPRATPIVDMLGEVVAGCKVIRRVQSVGRSARWELLMPCGHKQIRERAALIVAITRNSQYLKCYTCKPRKA